MARLVQQLNARLFERAWQMLAPPDLVAQSCLFVMGSEGRGEQLLKTDQDNGLLLRDGYAPPQDLDAICARFSAQLQRFGYPECPGGIMLSNPQWRGTDRKSTRLNSSHLVISYAVFCLKKKKTELRFGKCGPTSQCLITSFVM